METKPRDVFSHILAIVTLYFSATSFVVLLFQYINRFIPDALAQEPTYAVSLGPLRFAIASLLIVFPVFILISWVLNKSYLGEPQKMASSLRKWLIYFTLFAAALIILGDLVKLVYEFLGGEITLRFILKLFSFLLVAGAVFGYYLWEVKRKGPSRQLKKFVAAVSAVVGIAVVGGFFLIGSPKETRSLRLDEQRVMDLQNIQWQLVNFWQSKGRLPEESAELEDPIAGYILPSDPETDVPYEYRKKGEAVFELCANFNRKSSGQSGQIKAIRLPEPAVPGIFAKSQSWSHEEGLACFERTIDKELYPVRPKADL